MRRSLLDRTSHLFDGSADSAETPRDGHAGTTVSMMAAPGTTSGEPTIRRWNQGEIHGERTASAPTIGAGRTLAPGEQAHDDDGDNGELFERIVNALEARIVAELERRGRHRFPGVF